MQHLARTTGCMSRPQHGPAWLGHVWFKGKDASEMGRLVMMAAHLSSMDPFTKALLVLCAYTLSPDTCAVCQTLCSAVHRTASPPPWPHSSNTWNPGHAVASWE